MPTADHTRTHWIECGHCRWAGGTKHRRPTTNSSSINTLNSIISCVWIIFSPWLVETPADDLTEAIRYARISCWISLRLFYWQKSSHSHVKNPHNNRLYANVKAKRYLPGRMTFCQLLMTSVGMLKLGYTGGLISVDLRVKITNSVRMSDHWRIQKQCSKNRPR